VNVDSPSRLERDIRVLERRRKDEVERGERRLGKLA